MSGLGETPDRVGRQYDEELFDYESDRLSEHSPVEFAITRRYLTRLVSPGSEVADVGVGVGHYAEVLARHGCHVQLIDVSQRLLEAAEMRVRRAGCEGQILGVERASATDLQAFGSNTFDAVLLLGPLYHLPEADDRRRAVREAWRILKPQGLLFAAGLNRLAYLRDAFRLKPEEGAKRLAYHRQYLQDGVLDEAHELQKFTGHLTTVEEFDALFDRLSFKKHALVGTESFTGAWQNRFPNLAQADVDAWLELVEQTGAMPEGLAVSDHFLYIGEKLLLIA